MCAQVPPDCVEAVEEAAPMLANLLHYSDTKVGGGGKEGARE